MEFTYRDIKNKAANIRLPKDYEEFVWSNIYHPIVYDRKNRQAKCYACEKTFAYDYHNTIEFPGRTIHHIQRFKKGDRITCPLCGKKTVVLPDTSNYFRSIQTMIAWKERGVVYIALIDNFYKIEKGKACKELRIYPQELFRIEKGKAEAYLFSGVGPSKLNSVYVHPQLKIYTQIHKSVKHTLQHSFLKYADVKVSSYDIGTAIKKLALYARYPQTEYLEKAGLGQMVTDKLYGLPNYINPNWQGKTLPEVLGISHQDIDKLKQWDMWQPEAIAAYKMMKKHSKKITKKQMQIFFEFFKDAQPFYAGAMKGLNLARTAAYLNKQYEENRPECSKGAYGYAKSFVYSIYKDYIDTLKKLEYPSTNYYLYPKNLSEAHDKVAEEYRLKLDQQEQEQRRAEQKLYAKRLEKMKKHAYSDGMFLIRPLEDYEDLSREGRNNMNCVATYYEQAVQGKTAVYVVRKTEDPETSFLTVEVRGGILVQCRGKGNIDPSPDAKKFVEDWMENIIKKKGKKTVSAA